MTRGAALAGALAVGGQKNPGVTGGHLVNMPALKQPNAGPLMLQGDHGKVRFRNIVVTLAT